MAGDSAAAGSAGRVACAAANPASPKTTPTTIATDILAICRVKPFMTPFLYVKPITCRCPVGGLPMHLRDAWGALGKHYYPRYYRAKCSLHRSRRPDFVAGKPRPEVGRCGCIRPILLDQGKVTPIRTAVNSIDAMT